MTCLFDNILVTGCGGDIGICIARILKKENCCQCLIGCDIQENHPGILFFDDCTRISSAKSENYFADLYFLTKKYNINLIIPSNEAEIKTFLQNDFQENFGSIPVLLPNKKALEIGLDKLKTIQFLKLAGIAYPWTKIVREGLPDSLPCIIKSRFGSGSKGVNLVYGEMIDYYTKNRSEDIWQELLEPEEEEYTCGLYRTQQKEVRIIVFKRVLSGGRTGRGELVDNLEIKELLYKLAEEINLFGSINVQLRLTKKGPIIFEINPRFSSTVLFRDLLGFRDLIWALQEKAGLELEKYHYPLSGIRIFRGDREIILPPMN